VISAKVLFGHDGQLNGEGGSRGGTICGICKNFVNEVPLKTRELSAGKWEWHNNKSMESSGDYLLILCNN